MPASAAAAVAGPGTSDLKERPKSPRARLFIALELPEEFRVPLGEWRGQAFAGRDVRLPAVESLHVTLVFLGNQAKRDVPRIAEVAFSERPRRFELQPGNVEGVPVRRPRLYAVGLTDHGGELGMWQQGLATRLQGAGLHEPEKRQFWPHVTLARLRQTRRGGRPGDATEGAPPRGLPEQLRRPFSAGSVALYRSTLRREGALYERLAHCEPASSRGQRWRCLPHDSPHEWRVSAAVTGAVRVVTLADRIG